MASLTDLAAWSPGEDDAALVGRAGRGDEAALTRLYERHAAAVLAYLRHLTGDREEAEELLQDTFVAAWRAGAGFAGRASARAWLCGIARRRARDGRRRRRPPAPAGEALAGLPAAGDGEAVVLARLELDRLARLA